LFFLSCAKRDVRKEIVIKKVSSEIVVFIYNLRRFR